MPIEIRELIVRATVSEGSRPGQATAGVLTSSQRQSVASEKILAQVAEMMRKKRER